MNTLSEEDRQTLLRFARETIEYAVRGKALPPIDIHTVSPALQEFGASFVTLTIHDDLRGCIGALEAYQPLIEDVREHAVAAAMQDPRFPPVSENELSRIKIEISRLTAPQDLEYSDADDLLKKLQPHVHGVILRHAFRKATFLPQVWEKIPNASDFLDQLCYKMGARPNLWRESNMKVQVYQVEEFHELN